MGRKLVLGLTLAMACMFQHGAFAQMLTYTEVAAASNTIGEAFEAAGGDVYWEPYQSSVVFAGLPECGTYPNRYVMGQIAGTAGATGGSCGAGGYMMHTAKLRVRDFIADWVASTSSATYQVQNIPAGKDVWVKLAYNLGHFNAYTGPDTISQANGTINTNLGLNGTVANDGTITVTTPDGPSDQAYGEGWAKLEGNLIVLSSTANVACWATPTLLQASSISGMATMGATVTLVEVVAVPVGAGHP